MSNVNETLQYYDVIIVGTGVSGLFCGLQIPQDKKILMITKDSVENSDSYLAQGGISCLLDKNDFRSYYEDTMKAGRYQNNPTAVMTMIDHSQHVVEELIRFGVDFNKDEEGNLLFTREGGHSEKRILYHQDVTGKEIMIKLIQRTKERSNIQICEYATMIDLITKDNCCHGIVMRDAEGVVKAVGAGAVVLATGGLGGLFVNSTNFPHITGDSFAIALRHGVELQNIEYIQIHPTVLYSKKPGRRFLISESVRGEGAKLYNENHERFIDELLPRDVVAGAIRKEMEKFGTDHVYLSLEDIPTEEILEHFPNIYQRCLEEGYDITKEMIPVTPAQHYLMGGIMADTFGHTTMKGLYAVGETACNGVHGANRLASNSLLESLVFAENAAKALEAETGEIAKIRTASISGCSLSEKAETGDDSIDAILKKVNTKKYPDQETLDRENRQLIMNEIKKRGREFYDKWYNI